MPSSHTYTQRIRRRKNMGRAPCCEKVGLKKGRWSAQEDEILTKYIQANGEGSWRSLPKNAGLLRCGKSCRLRWINYLRSDLRRGNISAQEEDLIIQLHSSLGNRWSQIASHLPGRTDNEIKNYWNSHLSRKIYAFRRPASADQTMDTVTANADNNITATKRKGGRTSGWAMKKGRKSNVQRVATAEKTNDQNSVAAAVPVPATPSLENEGLSITTSDDIDFEDFMVLEGDKNTEDDKVERSEEEAGKAGNNSGESGDGSLTSGGERETITETTRIQEAHLQGNDDGDGEFCLNDMVDTWLLEDDGGGVSSLTEEREINDEVSCFGSKKGSGDQPECTNTNGQDLYSSSPMPSLFEYEFWRNWDLGVDDRFVNHNESQTWDDVDKQNISSWLWEDDDILSGYSAD